MTVATPPLVSILIRSMDRPTLTRALDSAAAQTWPNLEIVVVAANGAAHRPLPDAWKGRPLRLVRAQPERRLARPDAANVALQAARGKWLNFLDDDDELLPQHLATLLAAPRAQDERVVFSRTRVIDAQGRTLGHVSHAGNHVQLYFHSRATTCALLFQRSLVDEGVRFDPAFAVHEDHDFQVGCATRTPFRYVDEATCLWHAQAGDSGCGFGANADAALRTEHVLRLRSKWDAAFRHWLGDAEAVWSAGRQYLQGGDRVAARACFEQVLHLRPGDAAATQALAAIASQPVAAMSDAAPAQATHNDPALVSILIRSMDRPTLERALDSAAAQTWPNIELVVVAACGSRHRALPETWKGRQLRLVFPHPDRNLPRPDAANACLDAARGAWLNFLDDDDELLPAHVATLLSAPRTPAARVVYARARVHDQHGKAVGSVGFASYPVQLYYQNRSHPAATLFQRSLVEEGARFDPDFPVYEDHDFFINCATRCEFQFVDATTCIWNAFIGDSGAGHGGNSDDAQHAFYHDKLHRKWASFFAPLLGQPETLIYVGQQYLRENDPEKALAYLERALVARPDDINALNLAGMANLRAGNFDRAETLLMQARRMLPDHAGIRSNLDLLRRARAAAAQQQ
ncbi:MAG: glycosyltransferase [Proteobacteria bacterium]|uniref:glycosyltransferase n=1 Tax=Rudaea sp. TaxID=2136325 RepID=UPI001D8F9EAF|nr:glycosyltransferase [Pseudomonadota bacterium]MBS0566734.1 glycosyltransferase [Pseudomonadota bacterium]